MVTRRDVLKGIGGALGSVILTSSCGRGGGGSSGTPTAAIPNGYRFFRIMSTGDQLPGGNTLMAMPGAAMVTARREIYFYGMDQTDANGFYELLVDFDAARPVVIRTRKVVREGDVLNDSKEVVQINAGDVNNQGSFAAVFQTRDNFSGLYLERDKKGFEPVAGFLKPLPAGDGTFGAVFGDVDIHHNDDILFVAHFAPHGSVQSHQGLFHLPGGEVKETGTLVTSTAELIPEAGGIITGLGLVDMHDGGNYVLQAYGMNPGKVNSMGTEGGSVIPGGSMPSMLINGNVKDPFSKRLRSAASHLKAAKVSGSRPGFVSGEIKYGPRLGGTNNAAFVVHINETHMAMFYDGSQVVSTGAVSPLGSIVKSMSPAVVGADGLLYYTLFTDMGMELVVYNKAEARTILTTGDSVEGAALRSIFFGFMTEQVDESGIVVLIGTCDDGRMSLIAGIPV